jgi:hypothetical protein
VSLLLRPTVVPGVDGVTTEKSLEVRFIVPGGMVANLDFVESIFGNAGDPYLPENDSSLDPEHWTGHTGLVVLAPHLTALTKKELGMPHVSEATERQKRDGQCWETEDERYNGGQAFKLCLRDARGVIATVIADNYFGYCKKEVKTQISYSANLLRQRRGGARRRRRRVPGLQPGHRVDRRPDARGLRAWPTSGGPRPRGLRRPARGPRHRARPGRTSPGAARGATFSMREQTISWADRRRRPAASRCSPTTPTCCPTATASTPSTARPTRPNGTWSARRPTPTHCHKPATVSGGGKSEISKSILDAFVFGTVYTADFESDMDQVQALIDGDYSDRFADPAQRLRPPRHPVPERSLGSVIKLMTPSSRFTDGHNAYLATIPEHVKELLFTVKRFYKPEWGTDWRSHFSVMMLNGREGNEVRLDGDPRSSPTTCASASRPTARGGCSRCAPTSPPPRRCSPRTTSPRPPWCPGARCRTPRSRRPACRARSWQNCEQLLFQRPDDAIHRGYDKQTEKDMSQPGTFISNFEPLTHDDARSMVEDVQAFSRVTPSRWPASSSTACAEMADDEVARVLRQLGRARAWSTASGRRTRGTCRCAPTCRSRRRRRPPTSRCTCSSGSARRAVPRAGRHRRRRAPQQRGRAGRPAAVHLQPAALHGAARALHGVHQLDDRQVPVDDRRGLRGRDDEGAVQRPAAHLRPQRRVPRSC